MYVPFFESLMNNNTFSAVLSQNLGKNMISNNTRIIKILRRSVVCWLVSPAIRWLRAENFYGSDHWTA